LRKINLRAEYNDPTFMRTWLGYETFRRLTRTPVPRADFVDVRINGERYGLMLEVERLGGKFLEDNGRDREAPMYEAQQDWPSGALTDLPDDEAWRYVWSKKTGDPDDYSDIQSFVNEAIGADLADSPSLRDTCVDRTSLAMDMEAYVDYLAVMALIQNNDHVTNNFYVSLQAAYGGDEAMYQRYRQRICSLSEGDWWTKDAPDLVAAMGRRLAADVEHDPNDRNSSLADYDAAVVEMESFFQLRAAHLKWAVRCPGSYEPSELTP